MQLACSQARAPLPKHTMRHHAVTTDMQKQTPKQTQSDAAQRSAGGEGGKHSSCLPAPPSPAAACSNCRLRTEASSACACATSAAARSVSSCWACTQTLSHGGAPATPAGASDETNPGMSNETTPEWVWVCAVVSQPLAKRTEQTTKTPVWAAQPEGGSGRAQPSTASRTCSVDSSVFAAASSCSSSAFRVCTEPSWPWALHTCNTAQHSTARLER